jgi:hypothetical protein
MPQNDKDMGNLEHELDSLESYITVHVAKAKEMLEAFGGALYPVDILAVAVLNRSIDLLQGFSLLMRANNYLAAAPLVRLQLDNLLRLKAVWLVSNPHEFVMKVMKGTPIRKLKDADDNKMHDAYLVQKLESEVPWIRRLYQSTSGFVHLSEKHIFSLFKKQIESGDSVEISIGGTGENISLRNKVEAIKAYSAITKQILFLIDGWIVTKQNPEAVAALKEERFNPRHNNAPKPRQ